MIITLIDFLKDRLQAVKIGCYIGIAVMLVWSVVAVDTHHAHTWMEAHIPGFWSIFTLLILCGSHLLCEMVWQKWNHDPRGLL